MTFEGTTARPRRRGGVFRRPRLDAALDDPAPIGGPDPIDPTPDPIDREPQPPDDPIDPGQPPIVRNPDDFPISDPDPMGAFTGTEPFTAPGSRRVTEVGDQTIPGGATLVRIRNPQGSDAPAIFVLQYRIFGVDFAFEIGDRSRVEEIFGGVDAFDDVVTFQNQRQFDNQEFIAAGSVDEILGSTESLVSQIERGIRALGIEGVPEWMANDRQAMTLAVLAEQDGWSQTRLYDELAKTQGFQNRFGDLGLIAQRTGTDDTLANVTEFLRSEASIRSALQQFRGPNTDTTQEYLRNLVTSGWQEAEVIELLELERDLVENPDALVNINELLAPSGIQLTDSDFVSFLQEGRRADQEGFTPSELFRTVNDALRLTELERAGLTGITDELARELGMGDTGAGIVDPTFFRDQAQQVAAIVAANFHELQAERFGLNRDDVLRFFLEGEDPNPDTKRLLERFARDRGISARGFDTVQSFIDSQGRPRVQGFADLTG